MTLSVDDTLQQVGEDIRGGRLDQAAGRCEALLADRPDTFGALHMLGVIRAQQGRVDEAAHIIEKAIAINPASANAVNDYGVLFLNLGQHDRALEQFDRARTLTPDDPQILFNRGTALRKLARYDEALDCYDSVLDLAPNHPDTLFIRGFTLTQLGRLSDAVECYDALLAVQPQNLDGRFNRAGALRELGRLGEALGEYDRIIGIRPDHMSALFNRGLTLHLMNRFTEAFDCFNRFLTHSPGNADALNNRGNALYRLGRYDEALASYSKALAADPVHPNALPSLVNQKRHMCDWYDLDAVTERLLRAMEDGKANTDPLALLAISDDPALQQDCAERRWARIKSGTARSGPQVSVARDRIRLGYLSAQFSEHAIAQQTVELFELHDRSRFEVCAFSYGGDENSALRRRLRAGFDRFTDLSGAGDSRIAQVIREQGIDIVIEMDGLIHNSRCQVLSHRPAPVQVHYFGFPGTIGADAVDYAIVDPFLVPPESARFFTEKLAYLPHCYMMSDRKREVAPGSPTRAECGLPEQGFVFCSFNNNYKISPSVYDVWMRLLKAVPGSVLWLLGDNRWAMENLCCEAEARGVTRERIVFAPRVPRPVHLARQVNADLMLDTLLFNGHTTTSDALWMGVPLVSCAGRSFAARVAGSLLTAVGLSELAVDNLSAYEAVALDLATHPDRLATIRMRLRASRDTAPHFDSDGTRRAIESAYEHMWKRHLAGLPPETFSV